MKIAKISILSFAIIAITVFLILIGNVDPIDTIKDNLESIKFFSTDKTSAGEKSSNLSLPDFRPGISDKMSMSYEEYIADINNQTPSPPVSDSEMIHIIFPNDWLLQNDEDERSSIVKITFPKDWLNETPANKSEQIAILRIPKRMLELDNTNTNPDMITISYPIEMFSFIDITQATQNKTS